MAIALDATVRGGGTGASSYLASLTVGAGSNRHLFVTVAWRRDAAQNCSSVTFGAAGLTLIGGIGGATGDAFTRIELWYLLAPASSTANVTVTMSASARVEFAAVARTGVHQTVPHGTLATASGLSTTATVNASSATGELVADGVAALGTGVALTVGAGQTSQQNHGTGTTSSDVIGASSDEAGAATVTMSWTLTSSRWNIATIPLKPVTGTLFTATLSATSTTTATAPKTAGKNTAATSTLAATIARTVAAIRSATSALTATRIVAVARSLAASSPISALRVVQVARTTAATATTTGVATRIVAITRTATSALTATVAFVKTAAATIAALLLGDRVATTLTVTDTALTTLTTADRITSTVALTDIAVTSIAMADRAVDTLTLT